MDLPAELRESDARLHAFHESVRFSEFLNPTNIAAAREAFARGAEAPPFEYAPATWADEAVDLLASLRIPREHTLGVELAAVVAETRALVLALRDRTRERFDALAELSDWAPGPPEELPAPPPAGQHWSEIPAEALFYALLRALRERGLDGWDVCWDHVLSSRVLVDTARRQVRLNPAARFREPDRAGLIAHEIDVHVRRGETGLGQPLLIFSTGLARSLGTEEGLAILAEERAGTLAASFHGRQALVAEAVRRAATLGFRALHDGLRGPLGSQGAWQLALRVKRGLADPGAPGSYAKDTVYLKGWRRVRAWIDGGGDVALLYVGKVGIDHPIADWLARGWIHAGPVPALFTPR